MSKKALLIAHYYYPNNLVASHRPAKLAKYLPQFGWQPTVVCADWNEGNCGSCYDAGLAAAEDCCRVVRVPLRIAPHRSWKSILRVLAQWAWPYRAPLGYAGVLRAAAEAELRGGRFDVIWSTFRPGATHNAARRLARRHGLPWVADFRDVPDQNLDTVVTRREVSQEVSYCRSADAMVAVNEHQARRLASRHRQPIHVIPNGFDPEDYPPRPTGRSEKFTIRYFGLVRPQSDPTALFEALNLLAGQDGIDLADVRVQFYGVLGHRVGPMAKALSCAHLVECLDRVSHAEMVRLQQEAVVLLSVKSPTTLPSQVSGTIPAKVFGYLAARRPILNVPGDGDGVDALLAETQAGESLAAPDQIARRLADWYRQWKQTGTVPCQTLPERAAVYSRRDQARKLAEVFQSVVSAPEA